MHNMHRIGTWVIVLYVAFLGYAQICIAQSQIRLLPDNEEEPERAFGLSVALTDDKALISVESNSIKVMSYRLTNGSWDLAQEIEIPSTQGTIKFATLVTNGEWLFVGVPFSDDPRSGAVFAYQLIDDIWVYKDVITPDEIPASPQFPRGYIDFGSYLAVDESRLLVSAPRYYHPYDYAEADSSGHAYVFEYDGTVWHQTARLRAKEGVPYDGYGRSLAISGEWIAIGASDDLTKGEHAGAIHMYKYDGSEGKWVHFQKLFSPDANAKRRFRVGGLSDQSLIAIDHTPYDVIRSDTVNIPHHFKFEDGGWVWKESIYPKLTSVPEKYGARTFIKDDRLIVMAPDDQTLQNESLTRTGSLYYFEKDEEGLWEFMEKIQPVRSYGDEQFNGPGLDFNEERILIGHPSKKDITGRTIGAVYILDFLGPTASDIEGYSQEWTSNNKIDVFPNPAYSHINVEYTVVRSTPVTITIYDILGRMVAQTTVNSMVLAGKHREKIDVSSWMPGMYILQLEMHGIESLSSMFFRTN